MGDLPLGQKELIKTEVVSKPETNLEADRKALESQPESKDTFLEQAAEPAPVTQVAAKPKPQAPAPAAPTKDEVVIEVEKIMEDGLGEFYQSLSPEAKKKFQAKGEEASREISVMVRSFKVQFKRALQLVRDWLLCIPGVNKFFLEQEAKIKVDRLIELAETRSKDQQNKT